MKSFCAKCFWSKSTLLIGTIITIAAAQQPLSADADTLGDALNATNLIWTTGGDASWQPSVTPGGKLAAKSGTITDDQQSWLQTTVSQPGWLSFWWGVSSEAWCDYLEFYTNDVLVAQIFGDVDWQNLTISLSNANTTLRWRYVKDGSVNAGLDYGWVGQVGFAPDTGAPLIVLTPQSATNAAGDEVVFNIISGGTPPLSYFWRLNGSTLTDSEMIEGANTPNLTLKSILAADQGAYSVVVSNAFGSVTSTVASLVVIDPVIYSQPSSMARNGDAGESASFGVGVFGTEPLTYQWRKDGKDLADNQRIGGSKTAWLSLNNVTKSDQGDYSVVVSNAFGNAVSESASLTVWDAPVILTQLASLSRNSGESASFSASVGGTPPLICQWWKDGAALTNQTNTSLAINNLGAADQGNYQLTVSNSLGCATSQVATLTVRVIYVDNTFNPEANGTLVESLVVQRDGKILVGGQFYSLGGRSISGLGRLNADGSPDSTFDPAANCSVSALVVQTDGSIIVGGYLSPIANPSQRYYLARLGQDGTLDSGFDPAPNGFVTSLAQQKDGKILAAGEFTTMAGKSRYSIARINPDGTLDDTFNPGVSGSYHSVSTLAVQEDGRILVGGSFTVLGGQSRANIGRLNTDGTVDLTFNPGVAGSVGALAIQPDCKILASGLFTTLAGQSRTNIGRLNPDGTLDSSFNASADSSIYCLALQTDGKILMSGYFTRVNGQDRSLIARVNTNGSLDNIFTPVATANYSYPYINCLTIQADGNILVGGGLASLDGKSRSLIGRLHNAEPVAQSVSFDTSSATWLRSGPSPEIWNVMFEWSTNAGASWTALGNAARVPGGWQLGNLSIPNTPTVRARGSIAGGYLNGSSWFVESLAGSAAFVSQPASRTNAAATTASFTVNVWGGTGGGTAGYQWQKDGTNITDGLLAAGARTSTLVLSNVLKHDEGSYTVIFTNAMGSLTSAIARLTVIDPMILAGPVGLQLNAGESAAFSITAVGTSPLHYQWRKDGADLANQTNSSLEIASVGRLDAGAYSAVVGNQWGSLTSIVATLAVNTATLDARFNPGASGDVYSLVPLVDGKVLAGGSFATLAGAAHNGLGRLDAAGNLDPSFTSTANKYVSAIAVRPDGAVTVGGAFTSLAGQSRTYLGRLTQDGNLDASFNPYVYYRYGGASVCSLAYRSDGQLLVSGYFSELGGDDVNSIGKLDDDGRSDGSFNAGAGFPYGLPIVYCMAVQPDHKILLGGQFSTLSGEKRSDLGRIYSGGGVDSAFNPGGCDLVYCIAVQADGKILVGGSFPMIGQLNRKYLARLNPSGSIDTSFDCGLNGSVQTLAVQCDGKILVGGGFSSVCGQPRSCIARLNSDGTLDGEFNPGANATVYSLSLQEDGGILVGGTFSSLAGSARSRIGRLNNSDAATQALSFNGGTVTWLRGGSAPEVSCATFDICTNGVDWTTLGEAQRVAGGWQLSGLTLPSSASIRARGVAAGGQNNGSSWHVQSWAGVPFLLSQSASQTADAGSAATFRVDIGGSAPLSYQWRKDGVNLADGGSISGNLTAVLVISNASKLDEGEYSVVATNTYGSVTNIPARLNVRDPFVVTQPASLSVDKDSSATLVVVAGGTAPFHYQWRRDGAEILRATNASLNLTNIQPADAGAYDVVITNSAGSITSATATVTVNAAITDPSFNPDAAGFDSYRFVYALALESDGHIIIGGDFTTLAGQPRYYLGRVAPDGSLDDTFHPDADNVVQCVAVQSDGKIIVGGGFSTLAGQPCNGIGRLNADGSLDLGFNLRTNLSGYVYSIALQPDGKILIGGNYRTLDSQPRSNIVRFNSDGSIDPGFFTTANDRVRSIALQNDGKIVIGGLFGMLNDQLHTGIGRLNPDGSPDSGFIPSANGEVHVVTLQADGKIVMGGAFTKLSGSSHQGIGRLNTDGSVDSVFNPSAYYVNSIVLQSDERILVGGNFSFVNGESRNCLARIDGNGNLDTSFGNTGAAYNSWSGAGIQSLALQSDGNLLVGGEFASLGGVPCNNIGRVKNTDPAIQRLEFDGATLSWLVGGTAPALSRVAFQVYSNGDWSALGTPLCTSNGWSLDALSLPEGVMLRAQGTVSGGSYNGSTWSVQSSLTAGGGMPKIAQGPASCTNAAGSTAIFTVSAGGTPALAYQWRKNGVNLQDGTSMAGTHGSTLCLSNVLGSTSGEYSLVISNAYGCITSSPAILTVLDPAIISQPSDLIAVPGSTASFHIQASGTPVLSYQWFKDGVALINDGKFAGVALETVYINQVTPNDQGRYYVVVTNLLGSITSSPAVLTASFADPSFSPQVDGIVTSFAMQPDGKIVVAGGFSKLGGQSHAKIGRLSPDGVPDGTFSLPMNYTVNAMASLPDGKILLAGDFTWIAGETHNRIARLDRDGNLDSSYTASVDSSSQCYVNALAQQPDGKIILGGKFQSLSGLSCENIGRLNPDGGADTSFNPIADYFSGGTHYGYVNSMFPQASGNVLVGGWFITLGHRSLTNLGAVTSSGSSIPSFNPTPDGVVTALAEQPDGRILVAGSFGTIAGQSRQEIVRLNANGSIDTTFNTSVNNYVASMALQADGKVLIGGSFDSINNQPCAFVTRLNADGSLDSTFNAAADDSISALALQSDGKILVAGSFSALDGQPRRYLGRLNNPTPAAQSLTVDGAVVTWLRGGSCPEVFHTSFDMTTNGVDWVAMGAGARIPGGWSVVAPEAVPAKATIRVRGLVTGGRLNGSSWFAETNFTVAAMAPHIAVHPSGTNAPLGSSVTFDVGVSGSAPLYFTWLRNGSPIEGADRSSYTIDNITLADSGSVFCCVVSNAFGVATSSNAVLTVLPPPANDQCDGAYIIGTTVFSDVQDTRSATSLGDPADLEALGCGIWYSFTPQQSGLIVIDTTGSDFDTVMALYSGSCETKQILGFNDDSGGDLTSQIVRLVGAGTNYYILAGGFGGAVGELHFNLAFTLPAPPRFVVDTQDFGMQSGTFQFSIAGMPSQTLVIETSTNLVDWSPLATNIVDSEVFYFSDPGSTNSTQFYRIKWIAPDFEGLPVETGLRTSHPHTSGTRLRRQVPAQEGLQSSH